MLSFLDTYSRYIQIRMYPLDGEMTTIMTNKATYCYKVMTFSLKNAGATYQRLMNKIFVNLIDKKVKVYIDDMVIKSTNVKNHPTYIETILNTIRLHNMCLN